jgi:hypothetical protein
LEFGAAVSVNLGVARGSVSVMGGIYFKYTQDEGIWIEGYGNWKAAPFSAWARHYSKR